MDLKQQLDAAIGDGPALRPVEDAVRAGRRSLRRRRLTTAGAVLGVLAVVGVSTTLAVGDEPRAERSTYVGTDEPSPTTPDTPVVERHPEQVPTGLPDTCKDDPDPECVPELVGWTREGTLVRLEGVVVSRLVRDPILSGDAVHSAAVEASYAGQTWWVHLEWAPGGEASGMSPAWVDATTFEEWVAEGKAGAWGEGMTQGSGERPDDPLDLEWWDLSTGELVVPDGVTVVRVVDNPMQLDAPHDSKGLVVDHEGTRYWMLTDQTVTRGSGGTGGSSVEAAEAGYPDFDTWLADQVALHQGEPTLQLVEFRGDGTLAALPDVRLVRQQAHPDLPADFSEPGVVTAVAEVVYDGRTWFVLARDAEDGPAEYFPSSGPQVGSSLAEFLDWARERYSEGEEGLR